VRKFYTCKLSVLVSILKNSYKNFNSHRPSQKKQPLREAATLVQENTSYLFKNEAIVCSVFPFGFFSVEKELYFLDFILWH
jgi:hypothetical protein